MYAKYGIEIEKKLQKAFWDWLYSSDSKKRLKDAGFDIDIGQISVKIASRDDTYSLIDDTTGRKIPFELILAKGLAIRYKFARINQSEISESDILIYLDGDGQIPFDIIFTMMDRLRNYDYVLAKRANNFGIDEPRKNIEQFENFIVSKYFDIDELPDAQCGCWGFRLKILPKIYHGLKANSFEIELDVLISMLEIGIKPHFFDIDIINDVNNQSNFTAKDHLTKLKFLSFRLKLESDEFKRFHQEFILKNKKILDVSYVNLFDSNELYKSKG